METTRDSVGTAAPGCPTERSAAVEAAREFAKKRLDGTAMVNRSLACLCRMVRIARENNKLQFIPKVRLLREPAPRRGFLEQEKFG